MKKKLPKRRNPIAFDLHTNGLYKQQVIQNKKKYNRKKEKMVIRKELSSFCFFIFKSINRFLFQIYIHRMDSFNQSFFIHL